MPRVIAALILATWTGLLAAAPRQEAGVPSAVDPQIREVVDRFFAAQVAEDADAYLALWSATAQRPALAQLKFIFDSGDDLFTDVNIVRVTEVDGRIRVRVFATRNRTDSKNMRPDGTPYRYRTQLTLALALVREGGALKIVSEGSPADDLASAVLASPTAESRAALMDGEPDLMGEALIAALSRNADMAARGGGFVAARRVYDIVIEVARRAGKPKAEGQALQNIGNAAYFQRDFPAALEAYRRRLDVESAIPNEEGIAEALSSIGTVQYSRFEYGDALTTYRQAAAIQEQLGDNNALGSTLISTGNVQFIQADYEGALRDYSRSRGLSHKAFNFGSEARAIEGMGRTYAAQGDYAAALEAFDFVLKDARAHGTPPMRGNAAQNIGDVHFRIGNLEVARAAFEESRTHFEAARDSRAVGRAWQAIALTDLVATRFAAAEQEYGKSMAACAQVKDSDCVARATVGLAFAQSSQEHYDEAIATYKKAIDAFALLNKAGDAARAEVGLSQAYLGRKDYDLARLAATRARDAAEKLSAEDILWRATTAQARAWRRLGSPDKALGAVREAVVVVQRIADAAVRNPSQHVSSDSASAYAFLAVMLAETGDSQGALLALEQRRAHALRTVLAANEREIWRGMTQTERDEERRLSAAVASVSAQLEQERLLPRPDTERIDALSGRLLDAINARVDARQRLFERLPELRAWRGLTLPTAVADLTTAVPAGATVVEMAIDEDDLVAVTIVPGDEGPSIAASVRAGRRQAVAETIGALTAERLRDPVEWRRVASDVATLLPEQALATMTSAKRLVVIPDDVLWRVPVEALPAGTGFVGDAVAVEYAASLSSLRAPRRTSTAVSAWMIAGAPDLAADRVERVRSTAPGWTPRDPEEARAEIERVARIGEGTTALTGADATEAALRAKSPGAGVVHIAAPFRINGASPLFSRIYLTGGTDADGMDDGALDAREIFNIDAPAQIAVFTDGTAGAMRDAASSWPVVQWAWSAAGAPQVLAARWAGDPAASQELVAEFAARLHAGDTAAAALRAAQAKVRAREAWRAPFFWAGWVLIGGGPQGGGPQGGGPQGG